MISKHINLWLKMNRKSKDLYTIQYMYNIEQWRWKCSHTMCLLLVRSNSVKNQNNDYFYSPLLLVYKITSGSGGLLKQANICKLYC